MLNEVKQLVNMGVKSCSDGNPQKAMSLFKHALDKADNALTRAEIVGHIGYCYQLMGDLRQAAILYEASMNDYCLHGDVVGVARMRSQISSLLLLKGKTDEALELALKARNVVVDSGITPTDLCTLTGGVVDALCAKRRASGLKEWFGYTWEILKWTLVEYKEAKSMFKKNSSGISAVGYMISSKHNSNSRWQQIPSGT